jgi:uncharacterized protein with ParB-like and HNH nuclease domain
MANWEPYTVADVISKIEQGTIVLPVIQRRLVWDEEKMELLFDTLLKKNSFGGIMALEEEKDQKPLFAIRNFTKDGTIVESVFIEKIPQNHSLIIDGQQRLQAFYIGITGSINGKVLYLDLFSDYSDLEFDFRFTDDINRLPLQNNEKNFIQQCFWHPVYYLFNRLKLTNDPFQVSEEVIMDKKVMDTEQQKAIRMNIGYFYLNVFGGKHVGIAKVDINRTLDETSNRQRIVELFRRLNDGGTRLSAYDLVASILKGFEWKMEKFLDDTLKDYQDIGMTQDDLIKLIFILRDNHAKEMSDIEAEDAKFAVDKKDRICEMLKALKKFLIASKLYEYYRSENRSFIPLYFIAYHIFHRETSTDNLHKLFDTYDTGNLDYKKLYKWIYLSLLNGLFGRGKGWIPYKTGIRKLLNVIKVNKNKDFPFEKIIDTYKNHPLVFFDNIDENNLNLLDMPFLFYVLYDREAIIRMQDIDHIQPINKLRNNFNSQLINRVENYQLLDVGTNRGTKREKSLKEWITTEVENKELYLSRHLIPKDEKFWKLENYESFLKKRRDLILLKIDSVLNL